jgi:peptide/nickel transport system permease protein
MLGVIAARLGQALFVLAAVSVIAFGLLTLTGDPVANILGPQSTPADRAALRERMRLDDPFVLRYARYVGGLLTGELGTSYATGQPVARVLAERTPATLELAIAAVLLSLLLGIHWVSMRPSGAMAYSRAPLWSCRCSGSRCRPSSLPCCWSTHSR